jgi:uncharacterized protein (DUF1697 family)
LFKVQCGEWLQDMPTFIALLRGVNVGTAKRVPMAELRALLEELGYTGVATVLNSGNAVFQAATGTTSVLAERIEAAISVKFGFAVPVIVKSAKECADIVCGNTISVEAAEHARLLVIFTQDRKSLSALAIINPLIEAPEQFVIGKHASYLLCANGILSSKAATALFGKIGAATTSRNWATTLKLLALSQER